MEQSLLLRMPLTSFDINLITNNICVICLPLRLGWLFVLDLYMKGYL